MQSQTKDSSEPYPVLGLDLGGRSTGVALSVHGKIASEYETIQHKDRAELIRRLKEIVSHEHVVHIVIGDPGKGNPNHTTPDALQRTIDQICAAVPHVKVTTHSEQFTSQLADQFIQLSGRKKQPNHQKAAEIILQSYLDTNT